jgi:hypothetical protein
VEDQLVVVSELGQRPGSEQVALDEADRGKLEQLPEIVVDDAAGEVVYQVDLVTRARQRPGGCR